MKLVVRSAVYGALAGGKAGEAQSFNIASKLQDLIDGLGGVVPITDGNFGDPSYGNKKHFGAAVERDGTTHYFACEENQTVDFTHGGGV